MYQGTTVGNNNRSVSLVFRSSPVYLMRFHFPNLRSDKNMKNFSVFSFVINKLDCMMHGDFGGSRFLLLAILSVCVMNVLQLLDLSTPFSCSSDFPTGSFLTVWQGSQRSGKTWKTWNKSGNFREIPPKSGKSRGIFFQNALNLMAFSQSWNHYF